MKSVELSGFLRENVGSMDSRTLRYEGKVPCVMYGNGVQTHFWVYGYDLKKLTHTPETSIVKVSVNGKTHETVLQEVQYHPVNESFIHADFLVLDHNKEVKVSLPVHYVGDSIGVKAGGKLVVRFKRMKVKALPKNLPDAIKVDISQLDLAKSIRVKDVLVDGFIILDAPSNPICTVAIPREMKKA